MHAIVQLYETWVARFKAPASEVLALVVRLTLGYLFFDSGWQKLHSLPSVVAFFTELGIPAPQIQAPMVACIELVGGGLLLVGWLTRLMSIPLMGTMVVAIITARKGDLHGVSDLIGFIEYLYLLLLAYLTVYGAGGFSLDRLVARRSRR